MSGPEPFGVAIAVATAAADGEHGDSLAESVLRGYVADGADPLRVAFAACLLLARADRTLARAIGTDRRAWLRRQGEKIAMLRARAESNRRPPR